MICPVTARMPDCVQYFVPVHLTVEHLNERVILYFRGLVETIDRFSTKIDLAPYEVHYVSSSVAEVRVEFLNKVRASCRWVFLQRPPLPPLKFCFEFLILRASELDGSLHYHVFRDERRPVRSVGFGTHKPVPIIYLRLLSTTYS